MLLRYYLCRLFSLFYISGFVFKSNHKWGHMVKRQQSPLLSTRRAKILKQRITQSMAKLSKAKIGFLAWNHNWFKNLAKHSYQEIHKIKAGKACTHS